MKCNQCVNCRNPQRKRPCVLARRKLLELLRQQVKLSTALIKFFAWPEWPAGPAMPAGAALRFAGWWGFRLVCSQQPDAGLSTFCCRLFATVIARRMTCAAQVASPSPCSYSIHSVHSASALPQEEAEGGLGSPGGSGGSGGGEEEPPAEPAEPAGTASTVGGTLSGSAGPASPRLSLPPGVQFPGRKQLFPIIPPSERCGQCKACLNPKLKKACIEARRRQLAAGLAVRLPSAQYSSPSSPRAGALASGGGVGGKRATAVATAAAVAAGQALGPALIGCRVRIYWDGMRRW